MSGTQRSPWPAAVAQTMLVGSVPAVVLLVRDLSVVTVLVVIAVLALATVFNRYLTVPRRRRAAASRRS